jgi:hypothetical protein
LILYPITYACDNIKKQSNQQNIKLHMPVFPNLDTFLDIVMKNKKHRDVRYKSVLMFLD